MRGIPTPDPDADFTADPAELFFDLSYVFAFSQLVSHLVHHPDWGGAAEFVLLFALMWLPWSQFTWSANAVAGNSRPVRLLFMIATVASVPMAGSVTTALGAGAPAFAIALSVILAMALFTMIVGLEAAPEVRASIVRYSIPNWMAIALIVIGAFLGRDLRIVLWTIAVLVVLVGTIRAGSSEWLVRPGHFAERHGLIVIVALGEVIVAVGLPVVDALRDGNGLPSRAVTVLVAAGVLAVLLWWGYFDRPLPALEHRHSQLEDGTTSGRYARDIYTYSHFPLVAGLILTAATLEEITLHPTRPLPGPFRWMLLAGVVGYLIAVVIAVARAFDRSLARERLAAAALVAALIALTGNVDAIVVLICLDVLILAVLVAEHLRIEVPKNRQGPT